MHWQTLDWSAIADLKKQLERLKGRIPLTDAVVIDLASHMARTYFVDLANDPRQLRFVTIFLDDSRQMLQRYFLHPEVFEECGVGFPGDATQVWECVEGGWSDLTTQALDLVSPDILSGKTIREELNKDSLVITDEQWGRIAPSVLQNRRAEQRHGLPWQQMVTAPINTAHRDHWEAMYSNAPAYGLAVEFFRIACLQTLLDAVGIRLVDLGALTSGVQALKAVTLVEMFSSLPAEVQFIATINRDR